MHVKGQGGLKRCVKLTLSDSRKYAFVARFDIASYYETIDHQVLLQIIRDADVGEYLEAVVAQYLSVPDVSFTQKGMTAVGALSPLLAAIYLAPLDRRMSAEIERGGMSYRRYMDDFVIYASSRYRLRRVVAAMHGVLKDLKVTVYKTKRFVGRSAKGFDFLGYHIRPDLGLGVAAKTTAKMQMHIRRLHEQGADRIELRRYVLRWWTWLHAGLRGLVTSWIRFSELWKFAIHLSIPRVFHPHLY